VETPDGIFQMEADWVIACDGANSDTRRMVGGQFTGQFFQDRFLIADIVMQAAFPTERWFWFDPPFHRAQPDASGTRRPTSVLLHRQADNVWRIDFQLGWDSDPEEEKRPEKVVPRIRAMLGEQAQFELEWVSVYQFACRRLDNFRHGRVLFAGDAAHQVSPFGARGANTGVQDIDNLVWKLKLVIDRQAPFALIDSYHDERAYAADDNLLNSTRSTDFITPKTRGSLRYRDAVLQLARSEAFARPLVNSGRLSTPTPYRESARNTPDEDPFAGRMSPGTVCDDAPVRVHGRDGWLLESLGPQFTVLAFGTQGDPRPVRVGDVVTGLLRVGEDIDDPQGVVAERYDGQPGTAYLIRPDQHVAARWRRFDAGKVEAALRRALHA
jgi:3-(3-hydroxy-phenyl)propionate hydroxylase